MSQSRLSFLKPLVEYLRQCTELAIFKNCSIVTLAEYHKLADQNLNESSILIIPLESKIISEQSSTNFVKCGHRFTQRILIIIYVDCPSSQKNEIETIENNTDDSVILIGSYVNAADYELKLIECIDCYNEDTFNKKGHGSESLNLVELPQPEVSNGRIELPLIYKREYII